MKNENYENFVEEYKATVVGAYDLTGKLVEPTEEHFDKITPFGDGELNEFVDSISTRDVFGRKPVNAVIIKDTEFEQAVYDEVGVLKHGDITIESTNGLVSNTVIKTAAGETLKYVTKAVITLDADQDFATATLTFMLPKIDIKISADQVNAAVERE